MDRFLAVRMRGQILAGVLVFAGIIGVTAMVLSSLSRSRSQTVQNISAQGGVSDLSNSLDLFLGGVSCATSGKVYNGGALAGVTVSTVTVKQKKSSYKYTTYSLAANSLVFANGETAFTTASNSSTSALIRPYTVAGVTVSEFGYPTANPYLAGGFAYPFQMRIGFSSPGGNAGPPPPALTKNFTAFTDSANQVKGLCGGGAPSEIPLSPYTTMLSFADCGAANKTNWTVPSGVNSVMVALWGAGGSFASYGNGSCCGGGGGGYAQAVLNVTPGSTVSVTVGCGGGGNSVVSASGMTVTAGGGGAPTLPNGPANSCEDGAGGVATLSGTSNGFTISGQSGHGGGYVGMSGYAGGGAAAHEGGKGASAGPVASSPTAPGGGSGCYSGGSGANGRVYLWY